MFLPENSSQDGELFVCFGEKLESGRNTNVARDSEDTRHAWCTEICGVPCVVRVL